MNRTDLAKKVLRSLCANTTEEEIKALENYRNTQIDAIELTSVEGALFELIKQSYTQSILSGPPSLESLKVYAERDANSSLSLYLNEVGVFPQVFGASYGSLLKWFLEEDVKKKMEGLLQDTTRMANEGIRLRVGAREEMRQGLDKALDHVVIESTKLKRRLLPHERPMDLESGAVEVVKDYVLKSRHPELSYGMVTNISSIDNPTGGAHNKELWILAGATGHGKSVFVINWARHLALLGFRVLFYSLEMSKDTIMKILYCSHSCDPKFGREPLSYNQIKFGMLSTDDANFYLNTVTPSLRSARGGIEVHNPLGRTTIDDIQQQAEVANREHPLDMIIIDYINILSAPKGMRVSRNERIGENVSRAKQLALEFDNGTGVTVVTPCQVNRAGEKKAADSLGIYDREAIADTSELEKTADALFTIYQDKPMQQRREAIMCNLKMRDSGLIDSFRVYSPPQHRFIGELAQADGSQLSSLLVV